MGGKQRRDEAGPDRFGHKVSMAEEMVGQWRPRRPPFRIVLLCVVVAGCGGEAPPPETSGPCPAGDCRIELEHITRITDADEPGILPPETVWLQETEAGTFVSASLDETQIAEFGPDGRLAGVIGRAGEGPGEFGVVVTPIPGPGDTLFAPDLRQWRITVFGPDRSLAGTFPMPFRPDLVMPDGSFLVAEQVWRGEMSGYPIHVVDREGRVVRSFGTDQPQQYRPDLDDALTRNVAPGRDGTVWAMAPARYILERWDPSTGEQLQSTRIRSDWFRESLEPYTDETVRPPPLVDGLWEDEDGLVWTIVQDADVDWEPPPGANEHRPFDEHEYNRTYDCVIEVVDPRSGRVLASRRFDEALWYRPPSRILVSPVDTILTIVAYDVWNPKLRQGR